MHVNTRQKWHHYRVLERCHQGFARGIDGGKFKRKFPEVNTRAVSIRGQNELVGKFKKVVGDMVSIRGRLRSTHTFQQEMML
jgi:hypothetical protein